MSNYAKTPTVFQMEFTECGAASLAMIFAYYGKYVPLEQMRVETGISRDGSTAKHIKKAAERFGFEAHGYRKETNSLKEISTPCIIHWNLEHFVVFEGFKGKYAYINDPAVGRRKLTYEELDESFTGIVLTFKPTKAFVKGKKQKTTTEFVKDRIKGQKTTIMQLLLVGMLLVFPGLAIPAISQVFMDDVLIGGNTDWFIKLIMFFAGTIVLQALLTLYRDFVLVRLQKKMALVSTKKFLNQIFHLPIVFFEQRHVSDLTNRISYNTKVSDFLAGDLAETVLNIFVVAFYLVLFVLYSPILTLIVISTVILNCIILKLASSKMSEYSIKLQQDMSKLAGSVNAGAEMADSIKAAGAETEYTSRILGYNAQAINIEQRFSKFQTIVNALPETIKMFADVLILLVGGALVIKGNMTIGMLTAFVALFGAFNEPIDKLVSFVRSIQTTKADIVRVEDITKYKAEEKPQGIVERKMHTKLEGTVDVKNLRFGYNRLQEPIVSDVSFKVECGTSVALVGGSGCGKSTISKLISGLYRPWNGEVLFDGIQSDEIPKNILNASITTVSQEITLFSGSVRDNLTMWNSNISESDMIAAAKDACIHNDITKKPGGYDYMLSENGLNFSGGQRQRLEIARALATNPSILIMDEATSALDPIVEKRIIDNIKKRGCTCIMVAHRFSTIRDCNQILVIDNGTIVQQGTNDELINVEGPYRELVNNL